MRVWFVCSMLVLVAIAGCAGTSREGADSLDAVAGTGTHEAVNVTAGVGTLVRDCAVEPHRWSIHAFEVAVSPADSCMQAVTLTLPGHAEHTVTADVRAGLEIFTMPGELLACGAQTGLAGALAIHLDEPLGNATWMVAAGTPETVGFIAMKNKVTLSTGGSLEDFVMGSDVPCGDFPVGGPITHNVWDCNNHALDVEIGSGSLRFVSDPFFGQAIVCA